MKPAQPETPLNCPLTFEPIFMERIWGGRRLASLFGKKLPAHKRIGESWEIVDREDAQSVVTVGSLKGLTLHELWMRHRGEIFGEISDAPRFPLLIKLLDAQEKLSLQVHPPAQVAGRLGAEPKTECWYVAHADPGAELYVGLKQKLSPSGFRRAIEAGEAANNVHVIRVAAGDAMLLPSGRIHAIGAGNVLVELQQNSDTTYRVFDWNRVDDSGKPRRLHVEEALMSINFEDVEPQLSIPEGELLVRSPFFELQKWQLSRPREIAPVGKFAVVCCLTGNIQCAGVHRGPGEFMLIPAALAERMVRPAADGTSILRITMPN